MTKRIAWVELDAAGNPVAEAEKLWEGDVTEDEMFSVMEAAAAANGTTLMRLDGARVNLLEIESDGVGGIRERVAKDA